jgi:signal transduction histidine kinase
VTAPLDTTDRLESGSSSGSESDRGSGSTSGMQPARSLAVDRLVRLQRLTARLAGVLDPQSIAEVVVDHILIEIGAKTAGMWLVEGDEIVLIRSNNLSSPAVELSHRMTIGHDYPLGDALVTRKPIFLGDWDDYTRRYPAWEERTRDLDLPGGALVFMPLIAGEQALGGLTYIFEDARAFDEDDRTYFDLVGVHVVHALERARLFEAERSMRAHVEVLYELAAATARATTLDEIFEPALDSVCRALAVDRASILLFDDGGTMRFRAWRRLSSEYRHAVDGHSPWSRDARDAQPILVGDVSTDEAMKGYLPVFEKEGIGALAFVPLVHERRLIGKFMIYGARPRVFREEDVKLATAIATHLAQAIARSDAEEQTKKARTKAEEAARAHAEMVAVVAHDLRNPLGVAQLKAQLMMRKLPEGEPGEKMKRDLDVIFRNTQHMARLIGDLLDAATIEANRIAVERAPTSAAEILGEAVDLVKMLAEQKGLRIVVEAIPADATVSCDRARVVQVLSNLLGNAMKYTPANGEIHASARGSGPEVLFSVADTGPGIPASERERVFERYVHGRQRGSVGLGLFIARGLVAAHGGRIWIEDAHPDRAEAPGTRVCFTLPGA